LITWWSNLVLHTSVRKCRESTEQLFFLKLLTCESFLSYWGQFFQNGFDRLIFCSKVFHVVFRDGPFEKDLNICRQYFPLCFVTARLAWTSSRSNNRVTLQNKITHLSRLSNQGRSKSGSVTRTSSISRVPNPNFFNRLVDEMVFNNNARRARSFSIGITRPEELVPLVWLSGLSLLFAALTEPRFGMEGRDFTWSGPVWAVTVGDPGKQPARSAGIRSATDLKILTYLLISERLT